jgi:hypothetical protein
MTFRVRIDPVALRQIDEFAAYLRNYDEDFAVEQIERLDRILSANLGESPLTWSYSPSPARPTGPTCSVSAAAPNTGSSIPSTRMNGRSTSSSSGTPCAIPKDWNCDKPPRQARIATASVQARFSRALPRARQGDPCGAACGRL